MASHLHLGGSLHKKHASATGPVHRHTLPRPNRGHTRAGYGLGGIDPPQPKEIETYHRHEIETGSSVVVVYRLAGYCPTPEDEELVRGLIT